VFATTIILHYKLLSHYNHHHRRHHQHLSIAIFITSDIVIFIASSSRNATDDL